jgi:predicted small lipoprotein YifL
MAHSLSAHTSRKAAFTRLCVLLAGLALGTLLTACGNRGPLYLPDQDPAEVTSDAAIQASENEEDDDPRRRDSQDIESEWP